MEIMVIKCHEFFECNKNECSMFNEDKERNCWDIVPTLTSCTNRLPEAVTMADKLFHCKDCLYYEHVHKISG